MQRIQGTARKKGYLLKSDSNILATNVEKTKEKAKYVTIFSFVSRLSTLVYHYYILPHESDYLESRTREVRIALPPVDL